MKVTVVGLWHLGPVNAACAANAGHIVVGVDDDLKLVEKLNQGTTPLFEPGLEKLTKLEIKKNNLKFSTLEKHCFKDSDIVWVTYDTPVDDDDKADVAFVMNKVIDIIPLLSKNTVVLVSSQLPVGSIRHLEKYANDNYDTLQLSFACMPENLKLGQAIEAFKDPDRVVVGVRSEKSKVKLLEFLRPINDKIEWMSIESSEMTKHAINSFLATSITFTNELASICEQVGASAKDVERGMKTESRIGHKAYVSPGGAFAGGTLSRDLEFLSEIATTNKLKIPVISSVRVSNDEHKNWDRNILTKHFGTLSEVTVAIWGLTYKPGTSTLRRSAAVKLCEWIMFQGGSVNVFDPIITELPKKWSTNARCFSSGRKALENAQALVVANKNIEFKDIALKSSEAVISKMLVVDANGFLKDILAGKAKKYCVVGEHIYGGKE